MRAVTPATPLSAEVAAEIGPDVACAAAELDRLLAETSRTFALSIPLLEEPTRHQVTLAYLLFRIADTFEDAETWPRDRRVRALGEFARLLEVQGADEARRARAHPARDVDERVTAPVRFGPHDRQRELQPGDAAPRGDEVTDLHRLQARTAR